MEYVIKRILATVPLLIVVSFVVFMFIHMIPGDPARLLAGQDATLEEIEAIRRERGLDQPLIKQYMDYMSGLVKGDLGESLRSKIPVAELLVPKYKPTLILTVMAMVWALIIGLTIGIISAVFRGRWPDYIGMLIAVTGISFPSFWLGFMLMRYFSVNLRILPASGIDSFKSYILPSITLGAGIMAMIARFSRSAMADTMQEGYIRTARAKGLNEVEVITRHAMRNSMIQVITVVGLQIGFLLGGSVIVESVFAIPGIGRFLVESITYRDYTVVQTIILIFAFQFIMINMIVDILYGVLNPKIRLS